MKIGRQIAMTAYNKPEQKDALAKLSKKTGIPMQEGEMMKRTFLDNIWQYFGIHPFVHIFAGASLTLIVLFGIVFADTPEIFEKGYEVGEIIYQLSLAYMASYIFYTIVVHIKLFQGRIQVGPYIGSKTRSVVLPVRLILGEMFDSVGIPEKERSEVDNLSKKEISDLITRINPSDPAPTPFSKIHPDVKTWWDYFIYWKKETEKRIDAIFVHSEFMEAEHVALLINLQNTSFFRILELSQGEVTNEDCSKFADSFYNWYTATQALIDYCRRQYGDFCHYSSATREIK